MDIFAMQTASFRVIAILACASFQAFGVPAPAVKTISASDPIFLGSVLNETWDTSHASSGYIDCMMPCSDVDLSVTLVTPGPVTLHFDTIVYNPNQAPAAGPQWIAEVDGVPQPGIVGIGRRTGIIATPPLSAGDHRVRFIQIGNTSGSRRWAPTDPQLSRVTGVTIPGDATLGPSRRPTSWFLPITDSIGEGYHNINKTRSRDGAGSFTNAYCAWPAIVSRMMNKSIAGYIISGIGVVHQGTGVPYGALNPHDSSGATDAWDHIFAGVPRPFTTPPDFIMLCVGSNELATDANITGHAPNVDASSTDANFQKNLEAFVARVRSKPQLATTPILLSVPFGGFKRTPIQLAVAAYKAAHPAEKNLHVFDLAFGSPALTTTDGVDEVQLFNGLTKNRPDDADTIPSPQAPDRTHPYAIATPAIGSVDAHILIAKVMVGRLAAFLEDGIVPTTGALKSGDVWIENSGPGPLDGTAVMLTAYRATGGSPPYTYQFQTSADDGRTWIDLGASIDNQASTIHPVEMKIPISLKTRYRVKVTDSAEPPALSVAQARDKNAD